MDTCETCTWWDNGETWNGGNSSHGMCRLCGQVREPGKLDITSYIALMENGFVASDRVNPVLLTGPKFGCIHHEQQETPHD